MRTPCISRTRRWISAPVLVLLALLVLRGALVAGPGAFQVGIESYRQGDYALAAKQFRQAAEAGPSPGALQNLGLCEWQRGRRGQAIVAWEQSLWLNPLNPAVRDSLGYARKTAQLEGPDLTWYEVVSTWLPVNWWAWIAGSSLWVAVAMSALPGIFRLRKAPWHQAVAAFGLAVFLLSLPALFGVATRSRIGFVLAKDTPLMLTPTREGQSVTRLAPGEPVRVQRTRPGYYLVKTRHSSGWVEREVVGLIPGNPAPGI